MREGNRRQGPSVKTIVQLVSRFEESGSVAGKSYKRATTATTPTTIKQIARAISRNPRLSVRRLSKRTGIPPTTIHRILRKWLRLFPFKVQLTQKMKRGDKSSRIRQCKWLAAKLRSKSFAANLLMTDEANFTLDGVVNKQNCRIWGTEIPCASAVKEQYPPHVTVWCGISKRAIIGPYFFEQSGRPATVTSARYRAMLETFLMPELTRLGIPSPQRGSSKMVPECIQHPPFWNSCMVPLGAALFPAGALCRGQHGLLTSHFPTSSSGGTSKTRCTRRPLPPSKRSSGESRRPSRACPKRHLKRSPMHSLLAAEPASVDGAALRRLRAHREGLPCPGRRFSPKPFSEFFDPRPQ